MNNLSWFIYLTQIVDSIGNLASGIMVAVGLFGGLGLGFATMYRFLDVEEFEPKPGHPFVIGHRRFVKLFCGVMITAALVVTFTPSRQTMLLIAGSEIGQRAAKSQSAQDLINPGMDLLKTWIKRETEKLTAEATKK